MIRLIAACTNRKRVELITEDRVLSPGKVQNRAASCAEIINADEAAITARGLYQGDHWSVAYSVADREDL